MLRVVHLPSAVPCFARRRSPIRLLDGPMHDAAIFPFSFEPNGASRDHTTRSRSFCSVLGELWPNALSPSLQASALGLLCRMDEAHPTNRMHAYGKSQKHATLFDSSYVLPRYFYFSFPFFKPICISLADTLLFLPSLPLLSLLANAFV